MRLWLVVLTCFAAVTLLAAGVQAQDEDGFGLNFNIFAGGYLAHSTFAQPLPENWQSNFYPRGGSMNTNKSDGSFGIECALGLEPIWQKGEFLIGLPVYYAFPVSLQNWQDIRVAGTTVDWWDEVTVLEIGVRNTTPAIGLSLQKDKWKAQLTLQPYTIYRVDYEGIDHYGAPNSAKVLDRTELESGLGQRFTVFYVSDDWEDDNTVPSLCLYYERDGNKTWRLGFGLNYAYQLK